MFGSNKLLKETLQNDKGKLLLAYLYDKHVKGMRVTENSNMTYYHLGQAELVRELCEEVLGANPAIIQSELTKVRDDLDSLFEEK